MASLTNWVNSLTQVTATVFTCNANRYSSKIMDLAGSCQEICTKNSIIPYAIEKMKANAANFFRKNK